MGSLYSTVIGRSTLPFQFFIGGRGIGKTYSALDAVRTGDIYDLLKDYERTIDNPKFMLLRRTEAEIQNLSADTGNPFKKINSNNGSDIVIEPSKDMGIIRNNDTEETLGYTCALRTFAKMRGIDFSDVAVTVFDEFIPEKHVHKIRGEGEAFFHFYETVNRNRELEGYPPLIVIFLANSISLANDILLQFGIVSKMARMITRNQSRSTDKSRGIYIEIMENAEFREAKSNTVLYKLTKGMNFSEEALNNRFADDLVSMVKKVPLNEYVPYMAFVDYAIYKHKSNGKLHIAHKNTSGVPRLEEGDKDILYWRFAPMYRLAILRRDITFDDYSTKLVFDALTTRQ